MRKLTSLFSLFLALSSTHAQSDTVSAAMQKRFYTTVRTMDDKIIRGHLSVLGDSQIVITSQNWPKYVRAEDIRSLTLKRRNSALRGTLFGFGIGAVSGMIIGFVSGDDPDRQVVIPDIFGGGPAFTFNFKGTTAGEKAVGGAAALGITGAIAGAIIGAIAKKKFIIGGKREKFHDLQVALMAKLVNKSAPL